MKIKGYEKNRRCIATGSVENMKLHLVDGIVLNVPGNRIKVISTAHEDDAYDDSFGVALTTAKFKYKEAMIRMNQHVSAAKHLREMASELMAEAERQDAIAEEMDGKVTALEFAVDDVLAKKFHD